MNKKRMWLLAISVATMVTATGIVMAATATDKQDNSTGQCQQTQFEKSDFAKRFGMRGFYEDKQALLEFLEVDAQTFEANIKDGKTLAVIVKEQGISEQELTDFMVKQLSVHIDRMVKEGRLPDAQAAQMRADIDQRVADLIHGKAPMHGFGPMRPAPFDHAKLLDLLKLDDEGFKTEMKSGKSLLTIAKEHDVSEQELTAFMAQQMTERINEDVKAGRIQESQAAQMKANIENQVADIINGRAPMHGPMGHSLFHNEKLLGLLNMDEETLKTEMKSGKSLLTIAKEHGVSEQSLKDLMLEDMAQHINQDVKEGRIPADKAKQIQANMENCVSDMINGKVPMKNHPQNDQQ